MKKLNKLRIIACAPWACLAFISVPLGVAGLIVQIVGSIGIWRLFKTGQWE